MYSNFSKDSEYEQNETGQTILILYIILTMLFYSLLIPCVLICFLSIVRILRRRGLITSSEERVVIEELKEFRSRPTMLAMKKNPFQTTHV